MAFTEDNDKRLVSEVLVKSCTSVRRLGSRLVSNKAAREVSP